MLMHPSVRQLPSPPAFELFVHTYSVCTSWKGGDFFLYTFIHVTVNISSPCGLCVTLVFENTYDVPLNYVCVNPLKKENSDEVVQKEICGIVGAE